MGTLKDHTFHVEGMSCKGCEARIGRHLSTLDGVHKVAAKHQRAEVRVLFEPERISEEQVRAAMATLGYEVAL